MNSHMSDANPKGIAMIESLVLIGALAIVFMSALTDPQSSVRGKVSRSSRLNNLQQAGIAYRSLESDHGEKLLVVHQATDLANVTSVDETSAFADCSDRPLFP